MLIFKGFIFCEQPLRKDFVILYSKFACILPMEYHSMKAKLEMKISHTSYKVTMKSTKFKPLENYTIYGI